MPLIRSNALFYILASFLIVSLFLPSGFTTAATGLFFVYCCLRSEWALRKTRPWVLLLPVLLLFLYATGWLYAEDRSAASTILLRKLPLLTIPIGFLLLDKEQFQKGEAMLAIFLGACLLCTVVCYVNAIIAIIQNHSFLIPGNDRAGYYYYSYRALSDPTGIDPIYLSLYFNLALIIALKSSFLTHNVIRISIAFYLIVFIFLLASKIGILIVGCNMIIWFVARPHTSRASWLLPVVIIPLVWIGVSRSPFLKERFDHSTGFDYAQSDANRWTSSTYRLAIWSCSLDAIAREPILGYGTGNGQRGLEQIYREKGFVRGQLDQYNAHNELLSTLLDIGFPGGLALVAMVVAAFALAVRAGDRSAICFMLSIALCFCVESVLLRQKGIVFFSFFYSFFFWQMRPPSKSNYAG